MRGPQRHTRGVGPRVDGRGTRGEAARGQGGVEPAARAGSTGPSGGHTCSRRRAGARGGVGGGVGPGVGSGACPCPSPRCTAAIQDLVRGEGLTRRGQEEWEWEWLVGSWPGRAAAAQRQHSGSSGGVSGWRGGSSKGRPEGKAQGEPTCGAGDCNGRTHHHPPAPRPPPFASPVPSPPPRPPRPQVLLMDNFGIAGLLTLNATLGTKWGTLSMLMVGWVGRREVEVEVEVGGGAVGMWGYRGGGAGGVSGWSLGGVGGGMGLKVWGCGWMWEVVGGGKHKCAVVWPYGSRARTLC